MKSCCSSIDRLTNKDLKKTIRRQGSIGPRILSPMVIAIMAVCALCLYSHYSPGRPGTVQSLVLVTEANAADLTFSQDQFSDGKARHFTHKTSDGVAIRYFIVKSSDGVIRAAFDACDVCFAEGKGYTQKGDFMVCNNCGRKFQSARINEVSGGCNPVPLTRTVRDGKLILRTEDIEKGKKYFDLRGGTR